MPRQRHSIRTVNAGFTLSEVMVTMFLISMMCLGIFAGLQQISRAMMAIAIRDEGYHLLQAKAEQLLGGTYASFAASSDQSITSEVKTSFNPSTTAALTLPSDNAAGRITFTRRVVAVAASDTSKTLRVEVQWAWQGRTTVISSPLFRTQS